MKVRKIIPISVSYPEPNDNNNTRYLTFCRIEADDGTGGWGE
jgi:L-alanine-DL-glutamate epimerase-like enolase superfamily enzyme